MTFYLIIIRWILLTSTNTKKRERKLVKPHIISIPKSRVQYMHLNPSKLTAKLDVKKITVNYIK